MGEQHRESERRVQSSSSRTGREMDEFIECIFPVEWKPRALTLLWVFFKIGPHALMSLLLHNSSYQIQAICLLVHNAHESCQKIIRDLLKLEGNLLLLLVLLMS